MKTSLIHLLHKDGPDNVLIEMATDGDMYASQGPKFPREGYNSQAEIAVIGLSQKQREPNEPLSSPGVDVTFLQVLRTLVKSKDIGRIHEMGVFLKRRSKAPPPEDVTIWPEFVSLARRLAERMAKVRGRDQDRESSIVFLNSWADSLEHAIAARAEEQAKPKSKSRSKTATKRTKKKPNRGNET